ncbi:MAG TPA: hypothetical protein PKE51_01625 [Gemmatimonadaceae bacterium]|nr:hypothetical protein [Gemmatimonadaceae bacterium]
MRSASLLGVLILLLLVGVVWQRGATRSLDSDLAPAQDDDVVPLTLERLASREGDERRLLLRYGSAADSCAVEFRYIPRALTSDTAFDVTSGRLVPVRGTRGTPLLTALARAHGATFVPTDVAPAPDGIAFDVGVLGTELSAGVGTGSGVIIAGAFSKPPLGSWEVLKLFLPASGPDAEPPELYLALNPTEGSALFLTKEPDYWPDLARQLARVLPR